MNDYLNKLLKLIDHNRGVVAGVLIAIVAMAWLTACTPTTTSLISQIDKVDAAVLEMEADDIEADFAAREADIEAQIATFNADAERFGAAYQRRADDLQRQVEMRRTVIDTVGGLATQAVNGAINPASLIATAIGLLGVLGGMGVTVDNVRKDRVIRKLKSPEGATE